jgi:hypothetical protein
LTFSNNWIPASQIITSITQANPGVVTTARAHGYSDGLYVRLTFPDVDGMEQANNQVFVITVLSPTTFSLNVDTSNYTAFAPISPLQSPQVIPGGEVALTLQNAERNNKNIIPET